MFRKDIDEVDTYRVDLFCMNCRAKSNVEIPRGTTVWDYCEGRECSNCGCTTLTLDKSKDFK